MEQITDTILMVRPARFGFNEETAASNVFQKKGGAPPDQLAERAQQEFDTFVMVLREAGVRVMVTNDTWEPYTPDAVFPNNWVTFHECGTIVTYPMFSQHRRKERRADILDELAKSFSFNKRFSLTEYEDQDLFLEGTGSLVLDRVHRMAYACYSNRTAPEVLAAFAKKMDYQVLAFDALDEQGRAIYHTNVIMALGASFAVICLDTIRNPVQKEQLLAAFANTQKEVVEISLEQMKAFAGNMLQVKSQSGNPVLVMSEQAYRSLLPRQMEQLAHHTSLVFSPLPTIEQLGGGSARCMMAEIFYPGMSATSIVESRG